MSTLRQWPWHMLLFQSLRVPFAGLLLLVSPYLRLLVGLGMVVYLARLKYRRERVV